MQRPAEGDFKCLAGFNDPVAVLLSQIAMRNHRAFRVLHKSTSAKLMSILFQVLHNRAEAEDALQDVYLKVWLSAHQYDAAAGRGMSWLSRVSKNHALSRLRSRRRLHSSEQGILDTLPDLGASVETRLIIAEEAHLISASLQMLKPEIALAIQDAYILKLSYIELAKRHNVPINTMRSRLRRGKMKLKEVYDARPV